MKPKMKIPKDFALQVTRSALESLINQGDIDPRNKTELQLLAELRQFSKTHKIEWFSVIDHSPSWLKRARTASKESSLDFSVVAYAIWLEHQINKFVTDLGRRRKLSDKIIEDLIRHTSTAEKFIWVKLVLSEEPASDAVINRIRRLVEARNRFVHYKWKAQPDDEDQHLSRIIQDAEKLVVEIRKFSNEHYFHGQKRKVGSIFRTRRPKPISF